MLATTSLLLPLQAKSGAIRRAIGLLDFQSSREEWRTRTSRSLRQLRLHFCRVRLCNAKNSTHGYEPHIAEGTRKLSQALLTRENGWELSVVPEKQLARHLSGRKAPVPVNRLKAQVRTATFAFQTSCCKGTLSSVTPLRVPTFSATPLGSPRSEHSFILSKSPAAG